MLGVVLDWSNYTTKTDLKVATGNDIFTLASKRDFTSFIAKLRFW